MINSDLETEKQRKIKRICMKYLSSKKQHGKSKIIGWIVLDRNINLPNGENGKRREYEKINTKEFSKTNKT